MFKRSLVLLSVSDDIYEMFRMDDNGVLWWQKVTVLLSRWERASFCCLTPTQQLFSYIMARTS